MNTTNLALALILSLGAASCDGTGLPEETSSAIVAGTCGPRTGTYRAHYVVQEPARTDVASCGVLPDLVTDSTLIDSDPHCNSTDPEYASQPSGCDSSAYQVCYDLATLNLARVVLAVTWAADGRSATGVAAVERRHDNAITCAGLYTLTLTQI